MRMKAILIWTGTCAALLLAAVTLRQLPFSGFGATCTATAFAATVGLVTYIAKRHE